MVGHLAPLDVILPPLSGCSSPGFQNPRQSSSPSAVAIGAKLVSPPLFQSMYSSARYSDSGIGASRSRSCTNPRSASASSRAWGVSRGMSTDQWSVFSQGARCMRASVGGGSAGEPHRQPLQAAQGEGVAPHRIAVELQVGEPADQRRDGDFTLQAGERGTEAEVVAAAEREV